MADALKLTEVARDKGFRERVDHFLMKNSQIVLAAGSPATDLAFAKLIIKGESQYIEKFTSMLVTVSGVATVLENTNPPYTHTEADDSQVESAVNNLYSVFAKGHE